MVVVGGTCCCRVATITPTVSVVSSVASATTTTTTMRSSIASANQSYFRVNVHVYGHDHGHFHVLVPSSKSSTSSSAVSVCILSTLSTSAAGLDGGSRTPRCRPVAWAAGNCRISVSNSVWNSAQGNFFLWYCNEGRVRHNSARFAGRVGRKGANLGEERGILKLGKRRLRRDDMDCAMPHLMDTAPYRGVCQAPSRVQDTKDMMVPMAFFGFGKSKLPEVVQAGDPVLHEPAEEVKREDIGSARIEKTINDMVDVMRAGPGVGLAAPQIGVPLQIIVLEDTKELMSYTSPEECEAQQRTPFDLMVIINPRLTKKEKGGTAVFFEGCLSVDGYRALVERHVEVEVTGIGRDGQALQFTATGWKARILQHEYDHLQGILYVDQMVKRTFRTTQNLRLPLPSGCPRPGVCLSPTCT